LKGVDEAACECLKWNYRGNEHLEKGEISEAIAAYDKAIETGYADQEGVVLLMRATAYLKRASQHKVALQRVVRQLQRAVPDSRNTQLVYGLAQRNPEVSKALVGRVVQNSGRQESIFQHTQYRHGLYQYALLHAAHDALRATQRVPHYAKTWLRAGEVLAELWKLKESAQYYETAMELDPTLSDTLQPVIARLKKRQEFLNTARAYGCSEDTLRLSLDVAG
jgi:tetratricopeptide (TPR) repeat protein